MTGRLPMWTLLASLVIVGAAVTMNQIAPPGEPPARTRPAGLSETGTLLLNGRPFFPVGIYHVNHTAEEYALLAANGFNTIQGHFTLDVRDFTGTLDLAQRHGLAVCVPLHAQNLVKENLDASLVKIRAAAKHPAVLSWKICDEPDSNRYARLRAEVPPAWRAIKALDPVQPVQLTLCQDESLAVWTKFCELVEIDRYPVPKRPLTDVLAFSRLARRGMEPWQNLTYVVQCGWTRDLSDQPSPAQARSMIYLALIGGAKGIFWYSRKEDDGWDLTTTPLWKHMRGLNREIVSLAPAVMLGADVPGIRASSDAVHFRAWRHQGRIQLIATNPGDAEADVTFTLPAEVAPKTARLAAGGQIIPIRNNTVRLQLSGTGSATMVLDL